jgi:DNA replication protein DnaC
MEDVLEPNTQIDETVFPNINPNEIQIRNWNNILRPKFSEDEDDPQVDCFDSTDFSKDQDHANLCEALSKLKQLHMNDAEVMNILNNDFKLGSDQSRAVHKIVSHVIDSEKNNCLTPLFLLVTGEAGTGKSKIIECVSYFFKYSSEGVRASHLEITASTGTASSKLYASTVHSLLATETRQKNLNPEWISKFQERLKDLKYLIIDEISMIGTETFLKIDKRLNLAKNNNNAFGNVSIIVLGDFFQIQRFFI